MTDKFTPLLYVEIETKGIRPATVNLYTQRVKKVRQDLIELFGKYIRGIHESDYYELPISLIPLIPSTIVVTFCEEPSADLINKIRDIKGIKNSHIIYFP
jgi:hypothetical protein